MNKLIYIIIGLLTFEVNSQEILIAAGSSSGTYKQMLTELVNTLGTNSSLTFKEIDSHGAVENLDLLINNRVSMAFMHGDVIHFRNQSQPLGLKFKTLIALHKEEIHILAPSVSKIFVTNGVTGGVFGYGATPIKTRVVLKTIEDLKGRNIGASGGGWVTATVLRLQSQIPYNIIQFQKGSEVMDALNSGVIDAAIFVGGAPLPNIKDLGPDYKLLSIPSSIADKARQIYEPANITYTKMSPNTVQTIAAHCLLVSRDYKTPKMVSALKSFRGQFYNTLEELKETPGNHPKWQEVNDQDRGNWPWLEFSLTAIK